MTNTSRTGLRGSPDDAGTGSPASPSLAPEGPSPALPAAGPDQRTRTAYHGGGHAAANVWLLGPQSVDVVSIRPGAGHRGITLLASPPTDRRERELDIIATLAGDISERWAVPISSYRAESDAEAAAVAATASLDELAPLTRERLLEAEDDEAPVGDEVAAERAAWLLAGWGDDMEQALHVAYLRAVAAGFVTRHTWAIRKVAEALLEYETVDGATVAEIVRSTRCVCHAHWTTTAGIAERQARSVEVAAP